MLPEEKIGTDECDMLYDIHRTICGAHKEGDTISSMIESVYDATQSSDVINEAWQIRILDLYQKITGVDDLKIGQWRTALLAIEIVTSNDRSPEVVDPLPDPQVGERWQVLSDTCVIADIGGLKAINIETGAFWDCDDETFCEHGERLEE